MSQPGLRGAATRSRSIIDRISARFRLVAKGQSSALDVLAAFREHCRGAFDVRLNRRTTGSEWGGKQPRYFAIVRLNVILGTLMLGVGHFPGSRIRGDPVHQISGWKILSLYWNSLPFRGGSIVSLPIHFKRRVACS